MDINLQVDELFSEEIDSSLIKNGLIAAFHLCDPSLVETGDGSVSVVVTDDETTRRLNYQYRGIDAPTDVLSFANSPDPDFPDSDPMDTVHWGDIIIAYPVAKAQAATAGHTPAEEVTLLAVHGALHLAGFDHDTPEAKKEMWAAQRQVLTELGLAHICPTEN